MAKRKPKPKKPSLRQLNAQLAKLSTDNRLLHIELQKMKATLGWALEQVEEAKVLLGTREPEPMPEYSMGQNVGNALNNHEQRIASLEFTLRGL